MTRITAVIFDMYSTLVQNEPALWEPTFNWIIREQGLDTDWENLRQEWRAGDREFQARRVKPNNPFESYFEGWRESFATAFQALGLAGDPAAASQRAIDDLGRREPYPETRQVLDTLRRQCRIAVLSNADDSYLDPVLRHLSVDFEATLSSEQARCYKPLPDLFLQMLDTLGVSPQETLYVGDRQLEDVKGARGVGMGSVWINRTGVPLDPALPEPDYQIASLMELPGILNGNIR